ncbi:PIN domain-containing protein [Balamuthia mandrillaris]
MFFTGSGSTEWGSMPPLSPPQLFSISGSSSPSGGSKFPFHEGEAYRSHNNPTDNKWFDTPQFSGVVSPPSLMRGSEGGGVGPSFFVSPPASHAGGSSQVPSSFVDSSQQNQSNPSLPVCVVCSKPCYGESSIVLDRQALADLQPLAARSPLLMACSPACALVWDLVLHNLRQQRWNQQQQHAVEPSLHQQQQPQQEQLVQHLQQLVARELQQRLQQQQQQQQHHALLELHQRQQEQQQQQHWNGLLPTPSSPPFLPSPPTYTAPEPSLLPLPTPHPYQRGGREFLRGGRTRPTAVLPRGPRIHKEEQQQKPPQRAGGEEVAPGSGNDSDENNNKLLVNNNNNVSLTPTQQQPINRHQQAIREAKYLVVDTNVFLTELEEILNLQPRKQTSQQTVVVPMAVIRELDGLKRDENDVGFKARVAIKAVHTALLSSSAEDDSKKWLTAQMAEEAVPNLIKGGVERNNDDEILSCALFYHLKKGPALLITSDRALAIKAMQHSVPTTDMKGLLSTLPPLSQLLQQQLQQNSKKRKGAPSSSASSSSSSSDETNKEEKSEHTSSKQRRNAMRRKRRKRQQQQLRQQSQQNSNPLPSSLHSQQLDDASSSSASTSLQEPEQPTYTLPPSLWRLIFSKMDKPSQLGTCASVSRDWLWYINYSEHSAEIWRTVLRTRFNDSKDQLIPESMKERPREWYMNWRKRVLPYR